MFTQETIPFVHLDADAFFASVEQAADRRLRGRPVAVGGRKRGIIACASYEARAYGVYTPMPTAEALKRCPDLILLPGNFERYEQFSANIFGLCEDLTPLVEKTSIDEGYLDLTPTRLLDPSGAVRQIRKLDAAISGWMKLTVSHGLASNKLVAQIASKLRKPHGFVVVPPGSERGFLAPLPLSRLPGLGPRTTARLEACGYRCLHDLALATSEELRPLLGSSTDRIRQMARGEDDRRLITERPPAQSVSMQRTFATDQAEEAWIIAQLKQMIDHLCVTLRDATRQARTFSLRIRYTDREEIERRESLPEPSDLETDFYPLLKPLLRRCWQRRVRLRMVGICFHNLYHTLEQTDFLDPLRARRRTLAKVMDRLQEEKGPYALLRGSRLPPR